MRLFKEGLLILALIILVPQQAHACFCALKTGGGYMCQEHCLPHEIDMLLGEGHAPVQSVPNDFLTTNHLTTPIDPPGGSTPDPAPAPSPTAPAPPAPNNPGTAAPSTEPNCFINDDYDFICPEEHTNTPAAPASQANPDVTPIITPPPIRNPTPVRVFPEPSPAGSPVTIGNSGTAYPWPSGFGCQADNGVAGAPPVGQKPAEWKMTFNEEFNTFDPTVWNDAIWYEQSSETKNYTVEGGALKIWPQRDASGKFINRTIDTDGKFYQTYGYFEMEAKLPTGKGVWPAFWLFNHIGERRIEVDIMEAYPGGGPDSGWGDANLHPLAFAATVWPESGYNAGHKAVTTTDLSADFHTYAVKWEPGKQTFYFDGQPFWELSVDISDPLYILLDLWFGSASGQPDDTTPQGIANSYEINYVRAWEKCEDQGSLVLPGNEVPRSPKGAPIHPGACWQVSGSTPFNTENFDKHLYVAATGSDSNPGTQAAPFKTIVKASQVATPGTLVHVAPGTYPGGFQTGKSGTASARIGYISDTKWGAKIVPPEAPNSRLKAAWVNSGTHVDIVGFEVDGTNHKGGTKWWNGIVAEGSYDSIQGNHVHHIGNSPSDCQSNGGSGINANTYKYKGYNIDVIGNVVHDIGLPREAGCLWFHGIYFSTSGNVKNNISYKNGYAGIAMSHDASNINVSNNTSVDNASGIHMNGAGFYHSTTGLLDYVNVSNNIVANNIRYGIRNASNMGTHNTYTNNLVFNNTLGNLSVRLATPKDTITANPEFVSAAARDYRLKPTSPAIDKGLSTYAPSNDIDNGIRPTGTGIDIGAYEYGSTPGISAIPADPSSDISDATCIKPTEPAPTAPACTNGSGGTEAISEMQVLNAGEFTKHLYVATKGSDSNAGTQSSPFKTIVKASQVATPGTAIHVAPGSYSGGITTSKSGTASARIAYISDIKWGAKLIPSGSARTAWTNSGDYVDIAGFEVDGQDGSTWRNGIASRGSYNAIINNHVHHIATSVPCDSNGGSAINATSYYGGYHVDYIGNYVHHIGMKTCKFIQGLYHSTTGTIKNNVVHDAGWNGIQMWHDATDIDVANNTIARAFEHGIVVGSGDLYHNATKMNNNTNVVNNIVVDTPEGIREVGSTGPNNKYANNLVYNTGRVDIHLKTGKPVGTIKADPQFINAAGNDYRLKETSPAIDKGAATSAPADDINGGKRPVGAGIDIGAYESGATPTSGSITCAPQPAPVPDPGPAPNPPPPVVTGGACGPAQTPDFAPGTAFIKADPGLPYATGINATNLQLMGTQMSIGSIPATGVKGNSIDGLTNFIRTADPDDPSKSAFLFQVAKRDTPGSTGGKRTELIWHPSQYGHDFGVTYWTAFRIRIGDNVKNADITDEVLLWQLQHNSTVPGLNPNMALLATGGGSSSEIFLTLKYDPNTVPSKATSIARRGYTWAGYPSNKWITFVMQFRLHYLPGCTPFFKMWKDGQLVVNDTLPNAYNTNFDQARRNYQKLGIYHYYDDKWAVGDFRTLHSKGILSYVDDGKITEQFMRNLIESR